MTRVVLFTIIAMASVAVYTEDDFGDNITGYADELQSRIPGTCIGIAQYSNDKLQTHVSGECTSKSLFRIASITKTFTGVLLADRVLKGLEIDTPIGKLLPAVKFSDPQVALITLLDLATHTSGLPPMPDNIDHSGKHGPFNRYGSEELISFLASHQLRRKPGESAEYSNVGMGLLGYLLAKDADTSYADLVESVVLSPLGMNDTSVTPTDQQSTHLTQGYNTEGEPVPSEQFGALAGAGALWSTLDDMLIYLRANLDPPDNAIGAALRLAQKQRWQTPQLGLAWHIVGEEDDTTYWHVGSMSGHSSFVAFWPGKKVFAVVLASGAFVEAGPLGGRLMRADQPLIPLGSERPIKKEEIEDYLGTYEIDADFKIVISYEAGTFFGQGTDLPKLRLLITDNPQRFRVKNVMAEIEFVRSEKGKFEELILYRNGAQTATRVD